MTEILVDVNYGHPPERVWQALTDRRLLSEWFMPTDLEPHEGRAFRLFPEDLPGLSGPIEGELIELAAPRRMVMLWRGTHMHCRVAWELEPIGDGSRLKIAQTGFLGVKGSLRRKELQQTYDELLTRRLPDLLDRIAAGGELLPAGLPPIRPLPREAAPPEPATVSPLDGPSAYDDATPAQSQSEPVGAGSSVRPGAEGAGSSARPVANGPGSSGRRRWLAWLPRLSHQRRGQLLAVAGAAVLAVLTLAVISSLGGPQLFPPVGAAPDGWVPDPATTGPGAGGVPPPLPASQSPAAGAGPTATTAPGVSGSPIAPPPGAPLPPPSGAAPLPPPPPPPEPGTGRVVRAGYHTVRAPASGYHGEVKVENIGTITISDWAVMVTIQEGARLQEVEGASSSQNGTVLTFTPTGSAGALSPGESVVFAFKIKAHGSTGPVACVIDQRSCA